MSLKTFHVVFVAASIVLAFLFGGWSLREFATVGGGLNLAFGIGSILAGFALIVYGKHILKKLKDISYL